MAAELDKVSGGERPFGSVVRNVVWTTAREEKLLELWKSRRCLFDAYSVATKADRQQAFTEVAAELGVTGSV